MRTLVVAPQPFFTPRGTPFSVYYRTAVASHLGASIDLLTYGEGQDVALPGVRTIRIPRMPFLGPVRVGPSLGKLARDVVMLLWTFGLLARHRYEVVHAHEEAIFWCQFLKPLFGFELVYDMHSSLPQQLRNFEYTESRLLVGAFERLERYALRHADAVITICPALAEQALARMPDSGRHLLVENSLFDDIPLVGDDEMAASEGGVERGLPMPPEGRPLVLYAGTFEPYQGIDLLLRSFAIARKRLPAAFLLMVGGTDAQIGQYRAVVRELGLEEDVRLEGRVPPRTARELVRRASAVTSPRLTGTNTPLKVYEVLASGVPLVATAIPSHTQVLDDRVSFLAEPEPEPFARALVAALDDGERRVRVVAAARSLYERKYSRAAYEEKMRRLFELLGRRAEEAAEVRGAAGPASASERAP